MSGVAFRAPTGQIAVVAATAKTVAQIIAASNHRVKIPRITVTFEGATSTDAPAQVQLMRQTTAIGGTPGTVTVAKENDSDDETIQTTVQKYGGSPTEPTSGDVLEVSLVPVYQGGRIFLGPFWVKGGGRFGIVVTSPVNVDCCVDIVGEE